MSLMSQARADLIEYAASLSTEDLISRTSIPAHLCALIDERVEIPLDQRTMGTNYTAGDVHSNLVPHIFEEARELAWLASIVLRRTAGHTPGQVILFDELPPLVRDFLFDKIVEPGQPEVGYWAGDVAANLSNMLVR